MNAENTSKNHWLYILSPCVFAIAISLFAVIYSLSVMDKTGGWSFLGVIIFLPALLIFLALDLLIKLIFKRKVFQDWVAELIVVGIGVWLYFTILAA